MQNKGEKLPYYEGRIEIKKRLLAVILMFALVLSFASGALAESAPVYGAGTCHTGFTTSRYVDRSGSWNDSIAVYNYYVTWDDTWEYDFYQMSYAKNGSAQLSDPTVVFTGYSSQNGGGPVYSNASTDRNLYSPLDSYLSLYGNSASYSKIYLRVDKPGCINYLNNSSIYNMKTWGWFTK